MVPALYMACATALKDDCNAATMSVTGYAEFGPPRADASEPAVIAYYIFNYQENQISGETRQAIIDAVLAVDPDCIYGEVWQEVEEENGIVEWQNPNPPEM